MHMIELAANLLLLAGAVNTGVLISDGSALLFDCCDTVTYERLEKFGVNHVDMILCTQHRRVNIAGTPLFTKKGARLVAPYHERELFEETNIYWNGWRNRWHMYDAQPGPQVLAEPMNIDRAVSEGDEIIWNGYTIRVIDTPGATMGAVSYLVEVNGETFCFSGDTIYAPGKIWDLYSLQKGYEYSIGDYHGFLGNRRLLIPTLKKLGSCGATCLVPSHGEVMANPEEATALTIKRLDEAWLSYSSISSLRYWFPEMMKEGVDDPQRIPPAPRLDRLDFVYRIPETTYVLVSETGAALVMDCGYDHVINELQRMIGAGAIKKIEGAWITHYHDDHVDAMGRFYNTFYCPIIADRHVAEIISHPNRYYLPCLSHSIIPVTKITRDGESWNWHEFKLTAYHFPGQTLYHGALFVEGRGKRILFTGDSFSPYGIDDYCPGNRNFLGKGQGYDKCIELVRNLHPDYIINSHMDFTMTLTDKELDHIQEILDKREEIFAALLPWEHPNFGTDVCWVRSFPYEQDVFSGSSCAMEVQFTNHADFKITAEAEPVLPQGWSWDRDSSNHITEIASHRDGAAHLKISIPENCLSGLYVIPFRILWNGKYLGQIRHTLIHVI
ncbi:MAG: MBL fold metallo-hydrolase [Candidatus Latescibacteria bacterium]|nr:MBL fold metallo-hydrolase [Candidatus Latescibacterota bacterium]